MMKSLANLMQSELAFALLLSMGYGVAGIAGLMFLHILISVGN